MRRDDYLKWCLLLHRDVIVGDLYFTERCRGADALSVTQRLSSSQRDTFLEAENFCFLMWLSS